MRRCDKTPFQGTFNKECLLKIIVKRSGNNNIGRIPICKTRTGNTDNFFYSDNKKAGTTGTSGNKKAETLIDLGYISRSLVRPQTL